jgi:hypothetical protein
MPHKNAGKTVDAILKGKKSSIRRAPMDSGAPPWDAIGSLSWEEIVSRAEADEPGVKTIKKLLGEKRFDK